MPVDAHMLMALVAPRSVFATGGTTDLWTDAEGVLQALEAAGLYASCLGRNVLASAD